MCQQGFFCLLMEQLCRHSSLMCLCSFSRLITPSVQHWWWKFSSFLIRSVTPHQPTSNHLLHCLCFMGRFFCLLYFSSSNCICIVFFHKSIILCLTFIFSHLAEAFIQSDIQKEKQSRYKVPCQQFTTVCMLQCRDELRLPISYYFSYYFLQ